MANRIYIRHRGRTTAAQARALEELLPKYLVDVPAHPDADFWPGAFGRQAPLAIEIGFGNGSALVELAKRHPAWNCLGVDVYRPGMGALMLACEREELANVRIADGDALGLLGKLQAASVRRINVFFPDPWPKKKHHKRRLVNKEFAACAAACLEAGGEMALATDCQDYAEQMLCALASTPLLKGGTVPRSSLRPPTPFEKKALKAGHAVSDLNYRRID